MNRQLGFDAAEALVSRNHPQPEPTEQQENLERVTAKVGRHVLAFVQQHLATESLFTADELRAYVLEQDPTLAPASPDRIMRALRQSHRLNYEVENRRSSLYRPLPLETL